MRGRKFGRLGVLVLCLVPGLRADGSLYEVAPGSRVRFTAQTSVHAVEGITEEVKGRVRFDPGAPLEARGKVVIDAGALDTGNAARDRDLRQEVLRVGDHPTMALAMRRFVTRTGDPTSGAAEGNIHGALRLRGKVQKLAVPARLEPRPGGGLSVRGTVQIDMTHWGIAPPRKGPIKVDPLVDVAFELELRPLANGGEE